MPTPVAFFFAVRQLLGYTDNKFGTKILDFSEVPSDVLLVVTGTLARLLYNVTLSVDLRTERFMDQGFYAVSITQTSMDLKDSSED